VSGSPTCFIIVAPASPPQIGMSAKSGAKALVRQISAIVITFILWWLIRVVFYQPLSSIMLVRRPAVTLPDGLAILLAIVIAGLVKGIGGPLESIYRESIPEKAKAASGMTDSILDLAALAILYVALRSPVIEVIKLFTPLANVANVIYDLAFIVVGLLILYGIVKTLTE